MIIIVLKLMHNIKIKADPHNLVPQKIRSMAFSVSKFIIKSSENVKLIKFGRTNSILKIIVTQQNLTCKIFNNVV